MTFELASSGSTEGAVYKACGATAWRSLVASLLLCCSRSTDANARIAGMSCDRSSRTLSRLRVTKGRHHSAGKMARGIVSLNRGGSRAKLNGSSRGRHSRWEFGAYLNFFPMGFEPLDCVL